MRYNPACPCCVLWNLPTDDSVCVSGGREDNPSGSLISRAGAGTTQERRRRARTRGCAREDELVRAGAAELLMELGCVAARAPCVVQRRRRLQQLELRAEGAGRRWPYGNHLTAIGPMAWRESRVAVRVAAESSACSCRAGAGAGAGHRAPRRGGVEARRVVQEDAVAPTTCLVRREC